MDAKKSGITVKHDAIAAELRAQIKRGDFKDRLPSRGDLKRSFGVAFKTLDKALCALRKDRVVLLRNGVGVFVHPSIRGKVISECYFVFPGHKVLTDETNPSRRLDLCVLEHMLTAAHALHTEVKILPISPLNDGEINWTILAHLKRDDYVIFLGLQYWKVIQELGKRGCRCLVLSAHSSTNGLDAAGMPVMTFDVDYAEMPERLAEYFSGRGCRHPVVLGPKDYFDHPDWKSIFERLSCECKSRGTEFSLRDVANLSMSEESLVDFFTQALQSSSRLSERSGLRRTSRWTRRDEPPVDGIFTVTDEAARQVRGVLDKNFPSASRSLPLVCFDLHHTWRNNNLAIDALRKPLADMVRSMMEVICGKQPFEPKNLVFPFCEAALSPQECAGQPVGVSA